MDHMDGGGADGVMEPTHTGTTSQDTDGTDATGGDGGGKCCCCNLQI